MTEEVKEDDTIEDVIRDRAEDMVASIVRSIQKWLEQAAEAVEEGLPEEEFATTVIEEDALDHLGQTLWTDLKLTADDWNEIKEVELRALLRLIELRESDSVTKTTTVTRDEEHAIE